MCPLFRGEKSWGGDEWKAIEVLWTLEAREWAPVRSHKELTLGGFPSLSLLKMPMKSPLLLHTRSGETHKAALSQLQGEVCSSSPSAQRQHTKRSCDMLYACQLHTVKTGRGERLGSVHLPHRGSMVDDLEIALGLN